MNPVRIGRATSSSIHRLMGTDKVRATYLKEKQREKKLGIEMSLESSGYPISWGKAIEGYVYDTHIEAEYQLLSSQTDLHESGLFCGTADILKGDCVGDIKCPFTRSSFCDLVDIIESNSVDIFKKENPEYYWQLVSNSILKNVPNAELIVFMPYEKEVADIIEYIDLIDDYEVQKNIQWVIHSGLSSIPHIPDNSSYKNLYRLEFEVPKIDKELLIINAKTYFNF